MDVEKYLARIRVEKPIGIDVDSLTLLQEAQLKAIPFENLDIHYGRDRSLEIGNIFEKRVLSKRGGFCYELNSLFHALLRELGFRARIISARVATEDGNFTPEYDHLAIVVSLHGANYLVDVGFGHFALAPLPIRLGVKHSDGIGEFQILEFDSNYLEVRQVEDEVPVPKYIFSLNERCLTEFQSMCVYHQTSADSHFTQNKLISILTDDGRITLTNTQLKISRRQGSQVENFGAEEFEIYLERFFGIRI